MERAIQRRPPAPLTDPDRLRRWHVARAGLFGSLSDSEFCASASEAAGTMIQDFFTKVPGGALFAVGRQQQAGLRVVPAIGLPGEME